MHHARHGQCFGNGHHARLIFLPEELFQSAYRLHIAMPVRAFSIAGGEGLERKVRKSQLKTSEKRSVIILKANGKLCFTA